MNIALLMNQAILNGCLVGEDTWLDSMHLPINYVALMIHGWLARKIATVVVKTAQPNEFNNFLHLLAKSPVSQSFFPLW